MPETTPLIKAALNLRGGAGFDVYEMDTSCRTQDTKQKKSPSWCVMLTLKKKGCKLIFDFGADFLYKPLKTSRIGFMP